MAVPAVVALAALVPVAAVAVVAVAASDDKKAASSSFREYAVLFFCQVCWLWRLVCHSIMTVCPGMPGNDARIEKYSHNYWSCIFILSSEILKTPLGVN